MPISLPLYSEVKFAQECLPVPRSAADGSPFYLWGGVGDRLQHIKTVDRHCKLFRKSGVAGADIRMLAGTIADPQRQVSGAGRGGVERERALASPNTAAG